MLITSLLFALIMEAANTSETSENFHQTIWYYSPEDSHLNTHHRENLKSYYTVLNVKEWNNFDYAPEQVM
jgi:hypothetical protein